MSAQLPSQTLLAHTIAQRLRALRERRNWTLEALATQLSPSEPEAMAARIRRLEHSPTRPDLHLVARLALIHDVPVAALVAYTSLEAACYVLLARAHVRNRVRAWRFLRER